MKYAVILFDGMADYENECGETPMSLAHKPTTDWLASRGTVGLVSTVPEGLKPGSDVANLAVMGYDPRKCYTGRSPLEAISMGVKLSSESVTYRANLVTLSGSGAYEDKVMADYSAGEITTTEARELIKALDRELSTDDLKLYAGISYRHLLKREKGATGAILTPPHDISDKPIIDYLPRGLYCDELLNLMRKSYDILSRHPINLDRMERGLNPANSLWFWGEGTRPKLENFTALTGLRGAVISAVDLIKGIAIGAGMDSIDVEGATANIHTDFSAKARAAIDALSTHDYVYVHVEAPDECGHQGDKAGKIRSIELIDEKIVTPVLEYLRSCGDGFRILIMPDHATPYSIKTHTSDPIPVLIYDSVSELRSGVKSLTEKAAAATELYEPNGYKILDRLLTK